MNAHLQGFSETGGFGALSVNAADANSLQTTLGVRLTSRIALGNYGVLTPELRLGSRLQEHSISGGLKVRF